jgi:hypothetical protein
MNLARISMFKKIILIGHSLGGATSGMAKFLYEVDHPAHEIPIEAYCFGVPPLLSRTLHEKYSASLRDFYSVIYGNDFAAHTSFGALMDLQSLLMEVSQVASVSHLVFDPKERDLKGLFDGLDERRERLFSTNEHPKMYLTGKVCYLYDMDGSVPVKGNAISESLLLTGRSQCAVQRVLCTVMEDGDPSQFEELAIRAYMFAHHSPLVYDKALNAACLSIARGLVPNK